MTRFDAIIIGTGQAGPPLAKRFTAAGMKVAIVERKLFGGTFVNTGCTPTKTMVASAYAAHMARRAAEYGVVLSGEVGIDWPRVKARMAGVVGRSRDGLTQSLQTTENISFLRGHARFTRPHVVALDGARLEAP